MGSEMCIRDRARTTAVRVWPAASVIWILFSCSSQASRPSWHDVALDSPVSRARRVRDRAGLVCSSEGGAEWVTCLSCARRREPWGPALAGCWGIPRGPGCPPGSILQPARQPPPALALCWPSGPWSRLSSLVMRAALRGRTGWAVRGVGDTPSPSSGGTSKRGRRAARRLLSRLRAQPEQ